MYMCACVLSEICVRKVEKADLKSFRALKLSRLENFRIGELEEGINGTLEDWRT